MNRRRRCPQRSRVAGLASKLWASLLLTAAALLVVACSEPAASPGDLIADGEAIYTS